MTSARRMASVSLGARPLTEKRATQGEALNAFEEIFDSGRKSLSGKELDLESFADLSKEWLEMQSSSGFFDIDHPSPLIRISAD